MTKTNAGRRCGFPECAKIAKFGGFCIAHGGGKKCKIEGCTTSSVSRGFCVAHGGGKRCQQPDCAKSAQAGGFCWIHGGGKKCGIDGCIKRAQSGGACIAHGGGKRCSVAGCGRAAQYEGLCVSHGGYRRCLYINCFRKALSNNHCPLHGGSTVCISPGCRKKALRGGTCANHKLTISLLTQGQSSDADEADVDGERVNVSTPKVTTRRKVRHISPTPVISRQQKSPQPQSAAEALIAAAELVAARQDRVFAPHPLAVTVPTFPNFPMRSTFCNMDPDAPFLLWNRLSASELVGSTAVSLPPLDLQSRRA